MTADALSVLGVLFTNIWSLFTCFKIPGTNVTPASWALYSLLFVVVLRFVAKVLADHEIMEPNTDETHLIPR